MIRRTVISITSSGADGSATGTGQTPPVNGRILAIHLNYSATQAATSDVTLSTLLPVLTIITVNNNATDGWYYPRTVMQDTAGATITYDGVNEIYGEIAVADHLTLSIAQANNAETVEATIIYDDGR